MIFHQPNSLPQHQITKQMVKLGGRKLGVYSPSHGYLQFGASH